MLLINAFSNGPKNSTVLVCYGKLNPSTIKGYEIVILESKHYKFEDIKKIKSNNKTVFAYMSLGEVNAYATHYNQLKNYTLGKNEIWNSYYLDLRSDKTKEVLYQVMAKLIAKGFDGVFLDNIDNYTSFGPQKDQKNELVALLKSLKQKFPKKLFLQNAGLELIVETAPYIDGIAIESVVTNYSFKDKKYSLRDYKQYETTMEKLKAINEAQKVPIILIEYADTMLLYNQVNDRIKDSKFQSFIGSIDLQGLPIFKN